MIMQKNALPHFFGIRHLSPASGWHLASFLKKIKPTHILLEAPEDAKEALLALANRQVKPPVAVLLYTDILPVAKTLLPLAEYSPEYQAIRYAVDKKVELRCIDLPASIFLKIEQDEIVNRTDSSLSERETEPKQENSDNQHSQSENDTEKSENNSDKSENIETFYGQTVYDHIAQQFDEESYESFWERYFEQTPDLETFQIRLNELIAQIRLFNESSAKSITDESHKEILREAFMVSQIEQLIAEGINPEKIVVITGAYHVPMLQMILETTMLQAALNPDVESLPAHVDVNAFSSIKQNLTNLPKVGIKSALMPYSYQRLSRIYGYGAGNLAPHYFEMLWQSFKENSTEHFSETYISHVAKQLRAEGNSSSTASVIEAVRLSEALATFRHGSRPVLQELQDAIQTCLGHGELTKVIKAINYVNIGTAIGHVPKGVSQTPLQDDFSQSLTVLKLNEFLSPVARDIRLDLRENRTVKSAAAAWIDLHRSCFFHRLQALGIEFARYIQKRADAQAWEENWVLQWSPEMEIALVEANLMGETIEYAASYHLRETLERAENDHSILLIAEVIRKACDCNLPLVLHDAQTMLQSITIEHVAFSDVATLLEQLTYVMNFGGIRQINTAPLQPLIEQLFIRACLILPESCDCDLDAAKILTEAINKVDNVANHHHDILNVSLWRESLMTTAFNDSLNSYLSGLVFSILLASSHISEAECEKEIARRISQGVPAEIAAMWFEGLSSRNRYGLLSRHLVWQVLESYVASLDEEEFLKSVVFLRRAFSQFEDSNISSLASLLGQFWGSDEVVTAERLIENLSDTEMQKIDELNDFDFDF